VSIYLHVVDKIIPEPDYSFCTNLIEKSARLHIYDLALQLDTAIKMYSLRYPENVNNDNKL
tara:strand:+ start:29451 stop:29633 length:183 start_codon:yes stop_codon:yes gene_type:complete